MTRPSYADMMLHDALADAMGWEPSFTAEDAPVRRAPRLGTPRKPMPMGVRLMDGRLVLPTS